MARAVWLGLFGLLVIMVAFPATVRADNEDSAIISGTTKLPLGALGSPAPMEFYGDGGSYTLTLPVPSGMQPRTLEAKVEVPAFVSAGDISVRQDDRLIGEVALPPDRRLVVPLSGVRVADGSFAVTLRASLLPVPGYCLDPTSPLRLVDAEIAFDGVAAAPGTVADFLPPVLRKLTITVPPRPSLAEADAAVRLSAAVTARYGAQNPVVAVAAGGASAVGPDTAAALERTIDIAEGPVAGLGLQAGPAGPVLRVSGSPAELTNQTRLLFSGIGRIAHSARAVAGPLGAAPVLAGDSSTLRDLGQPGISAVALAPQVSISIDQTRLGRAVRGIRVGLLGAHTPLPDGMSGHLVAEVAGEAVDRWAAADDGRLARAITVPDRLLSRTSNLVLRLDTAGPVGRCGEFQPITLTVDGNSTIDTDVATPPTAAGLQSLPQILMPRFLVGLGADLFADTARAVNMVVALQRISVRPLDPVVVPLDEAISSAQPAVLIAADGWQHPEIALPVSTGGDTVVVPSLDPAGQSAEVTLTPGLALATVQTVIDGPRTLLVATTNGNPRDLDDLLGWLAADPQRWSRLDGVAVIATPGRAPITMADRPGGGDAGSTDSAAARWSVGVALAAVVAGVVIVLGQRIRRRGAAKHR